MYSATAISQEEPRCRRCRRRLDHILDKQKSRDRYWTNCHACRAMSTQTRRRKREEFRVRFQAGYSTVSGQPASSTGLATGRHHSSGYTSAANTSTVREDNIQHTSIDEEDFMSILKDLRRKSSINSEEVNHSSLAPPSDPGCSVCSDTFAANQFPRLRDCSHEPRVCPECFANWLSSQVGNTSWDRIVCPSDGCGVLVSHEAMKNLATEETYTRQVTY